MIENKYPYTDFHELNLDWFLAKFKEMMDAYAAFTTDMTEKFDTLDATVKEFTDFVTNYFDNLDVQQEINHKLDVMSADGTLDALLLPYFNAYKAEINGIVSDQNQTINTQNGRITVLEGRMDSFSSLTEGSTTGDAELMDIRVGGNGITYPSAGDAVRGQFIENENDIATIYSGEYKFVPGYILNGLSVGDTCDWQTVNADADRSCTVIQNLKENDSFRIKTIDANSARAYAWLDGSGKIVEVPERSSVTTGATISCPSGANMLVVNIDNTTPDGYYFNRVSSIKECETEIKGIKRDFVEKSGEGQVTDINCQFMTVSSNNKCYPGSILWDKGIDSAGNIVDSVGYVLTDFIEVLNDYAFFGKNGSAQIANRLGLYDENKDFIERVNPGTEYDVSSAKYIRAYFSYTTRSDSFFVGFGTSASDVPAIDNYQLTIKSAYINVSGLVNPFEGLSGVAFGTSLTARATEDHKYESTTYGYLTYLRQYSGMTIENEGIGGATIISDNPDKSIYQAIMNYASYADKDVCIIEGFCNDWAKDLPGTLGTYTDTVTTTVCGRLRNAIEHVLTENPDITVFVILDHYGKSDGIEDWSSTEVVNGNTQYTYYKELEKVCQSLGVPVLKEYELSGISELAPQYIEDYIHLNALGARQSGMTIWNAMKQLSPKAK